MTVRRFKRASFWLSDEPPTFADELLVDNDGLIVAIGSVNAAAWLADHNLDSDLDVDLGGAFVYPAFRDGHCHPLFAGRELLSVQIHECSNVEQIQNRLREHIQANSDALWVDAVSFRHEVLAGVERPRELLDAVSTDHAIVLHADDHHNLWVNTRALELAGLLGTLPTLLEGHVAADDAGVATGLLHEWPAMQLVMDLMPQPVPESDSKAWRLAQQQLISAGVVTVQDAWIDPGMATSYLRLAQTGELSIEVKLAFRLDASGWRQDWDGFMLERADIAAAKHPLLEANSVKVFIDGSLANRTAAIHATYDDGSSGSLNWETDELAEALQRATGADLQLHFHAIGDRGVSAALDAIERLVASGGKLKYSPVLAHAEMMSENDFERAAALGVTAQMQPLWARRDSALEGSIAGLSDGAEAHFYALQSLLRHRVSLAFGSDWPVSSPRPLEGIAVAATRMNAARPELGALTPSESISVSQAMLAYSKGTAQQMALRSNASAQLGTLSVGQPADFIALPINVFEAAPLSLGDLKVESVYLKGNLLSLT